MEEVRTFHSTLHVGAASCLLVAVGCGPQPLKRACIGGGSSELVSGAAVLRLDVYGAMAHCAGDALAASVGPPITSHSYQSGEPIKLDVPPGQYALVLTSYADSAAAILLGQACSEVTLQAGSQVCFDLTLAAPPPGGTIDMAAGGCGANSSDVNHCGGCSPCDQTPRSTVATACATRPATAASAIAACRPPAPARPTRPMTAANRT